MFTRYISYKKMGICFGREIRRFHLGKVHILLRQQDMMNIFLSYKVNILQISKSCSCIMNKKTPQCKIDNFIDMGSTLNSSGSIHSGIVGLMKRYKFMLLQGKTDIYQSIEIDRNCWHRFHIDLCLARMRYNSSHNRGMKHQSTDNFQSKTGISSKSIRNKSYIYSNNLDKSDSYKIDQLRPYPLVS